MTMLGIFVLTALCFYRGQASLQCLSCHHILAPVTCTIYEKCYPGEQCSTLVYKFGKTNYFDLGCRRSQDCFHYTTRHRMPLPPHYSTDLKCSKCCDTFACNKHQCNLYVSHPAPAVPKSTRAPTPAPTIHTTTKAPLLAPQLPSVTGNQQTTTVVPSPNCIDHEEDGIGCAMLDLYSLCTDKSLLGYVTAHKKCPKHCGFCTPATKLNSPTSTPPPNEVCADYEQDGLPCTGLGGFGVCSDPSTIAFILSHKKCRKYCGLCQSNSVSANVHPLHQLMISTLSPPVASTPSKQLATMVFSATAFHGSTTTTKTTIPTTQAASSSSVPSLSTATAHKHTTTFTTLFPCVDFEDSTFTCAVWASHGYCNPVPGIGYETAKLRCRKFCRFC